MSEQSTQEKTQEDEQKQNKEEQTIDLGEQAQEAKEAEVVDDSLENDAENVESLEAKQDKEMENYKEKFFYLAAEMENLKKRSEKEKENLLKYGNEKVLSQLIEVVDNLDRTVDAIANVEDDQVKNVYVGVDMVRKQFLEILKGNGLERLNALGEKFDPNFHEAMAKQPSDKAEDEEIIQVFQNGYTLNGRLLRPAKVIIAQND